MTYFVRAKALVPINNDLETLRILLDLQQRGPAEVAVNIVAVAKCKSLQVVMVLKVRGPVVQEAPDASAFPSLRVHHNDQSLKFPDGVDAVAANLLPVLFGVPDLKIPATSIRAGDSKRHFCLPLGIRNACFGPCGSLSATRVRRCEDDAVGMNLCGRIAGEVPCWYGV